MELEEKIEGRTVVIGVIGLGYVGLPLAVSFLRVGVRVLGFDIDKAVSYTHLRAHET